MANKIGKGLERIGKVIAGGVIGGLGGDYRDFSVRKNYREAKNQSSLERINKINKRMEAMRRYEAGMGEDKLAKMVEALIDDARKQDKQDEKNPSTTSNRNLAKINVKLDNIQKNVLFTKAEILNLSYLVKRLEQTVNLKSLGGSNNNNGGGFGLPPGLRLPKGTPSKPGRLGKIGSLAGRAATGLSKIAAPIAVAGTIAGLAYRQGKAERDDPEGAQDFRGKLNKPGRDVQLPDEADERALTPSEILKIEGIDRKDIKMKGQEIHVVSGPHAGKVINVIEYNKGRRKVKSKGAVRSGNPNGAVINSQSRQPITPYTPSGAERQAGPQALPQGITMSPGGGAFQPQDSSGLAGSVSQGVTGARRQLRQGQGASQGGTGGVSASPQGAGSNRPPPGAPSWAGGFPGLGQGNGQGSGSVKKGYEGAKEAYDFWRGKGLGHAQALALAAHERGESGNGRNLVGDNGRAVGAYQWHPDRRAAILKGTGIDVTKATTAQQREAAWWELNNVPLENKAFKKLQAARNTDEAVAAGMEWMRPQNRDPSHRQRIAREIESSFGGGSSATPNSPNSGRGITPMDLSKIQDLSERSTYGRKGEQMENVQGLVFHHTAGRGDAGGVINTLNQRGLGVQYVMDRDGKVYRTLPDGSRGAHMLPSQINSLSNANALGIEVIARNNGDVTPAQIRAGQEFYAALKQKYPNLQVHGHGELNPGHKQADEGMAIVNAIRQNQQATANPLTGGTLRSGSTITPSFPNQGGGNIVFQNPSVAQRAAGLNPDTQRALSRLNSFAPMGTTVTSTYRSPDHPIEAAKRQPGAHTNGRAIDVRTAGKSPQELAGTIQALKKSGFNYLLLEGNPPHIHAEKRPGEDFQIQNLGGGNPHIPLEAARQIASQVQYNPNEPAPKIEGANAATPLTPEQARKLANPNLMPSSTPIQNSLGAYGALKNPELYTKPKGNSDSPLNPNITWGSRQDGLNRDTFTGKPILGNSFTKPVNPMLDPRLGMGSRQDGLNIDTFTGKPIYGNSFTLNPAQQSINTLNQLDAKERLRQAASGFDTGISGINSQQLPMMAQGQINQQLQQQNALLAQVVQRQEQSTPRNAQSPYGNLPTSIEKPSKPQSQSAAEAGFKGLSYVNPESSYVMPAGYGI